MTAEPLKIMTTVAMKGVFGEIEPAFKAEQGHGFAMTFGPGGVTHDKVKSGERFDVVVSAPATLAALEKDGFLVPGTQRPVARSIVGVAVRAGAPRPKIDTVEQFKQALLAARSVAYTNPATGAASGVHFVKVMGALGIADAINAKAKLGDGGPVAEFVARGEAEFAIQQLCEHMLVKGVDVVGPVPNELQSVTTLAVALHRDAAAPDAGKALISWLASPKVQQILPKHGLEAAV